MLVRSARERRDRPRRWPGRTRASPRRRGTAPTSGLERLPRGGVETAGRPAAERTEDRHVVGLPVRASTPVHSACPLIDATIAIAGGDQFLDVAIGDHGLPTDAMMYRRTSASTIAVCWPSLGRHRGTRASVPHPPTLVDLDLRRIHAVGGDREVETTGRGRAASTTRTQSTTYASRAVGSTTRCPAMMSMHRYTPSEPGQGQDRGLLVVAIPSRGHAAAERLRRYCPTVRARSLDVFKVGFS